MRTCGKAYAIKLRNKCEELVGIGEGTTDKVYKLNVMNSSTTNWERHY
jgi:hypothetical protein